MESDGFSSVTITRSSRRLFRRVPNDDIVEVVEYQSDGDIVEATEHQSDDCPPDESQSESSQYLERDSTISVEENASEAIVPRLSRPASQRSPRPRRNGSHRVRDHGNSTQDIVLDTGPQPPLVVRIGADFQSETIMIQDASSGSIQRLEALAIHRMGLPLALKVARKVYVDDSISSDWTRNKEAATKMLCALNTGIQRRHYDVNVASRADSDVRGPTFR